MNTSNVFVPNTLRNANCRAIEKRDTWRDNYKMLSNEIRHLKNNRIYGETRHTRMVLEALQAKARSMMVTREVIRVLLKQTSYPYATKASV